MLRHVTQSRRSLRSERDSLSAAVCVKSHLACILFKLGNVAEIRFECVETIEVAHSWFVFYSSPLLSSLLLFYLLYSFSSLRSLLSSSSLLSLLQESDQPDMSRLELSSFKHNRRHRILRTSFDIRRHLVAQAGISRIDRALAASSADDGRRRREVYTCTC